MFKKLFGGNGKPSQQAPPKVDPMQTMEKLGNQIENVEKRAKVLENKVNALKMEAIQKRKGKDNRGIQSFTLNSELLIMCSIGALHAMKQMKMLEKELGKIDGMKTLLEQ
jgi:hypothetical protein